MMAKKGSRTLLALGAAGLVLVLTGACLAASQGLDGALVRYPGAVRVAAEAFSLHWSDQRAIQRQATDQTADDANTVRTWYAQRIKVSTAPNQYLIGSDGCTLLTQAGRTLGVHHAVSVLVCSLPHGTRIIINESWSLGP